MYLPPEPMPTDASMAAANAANAAPSGPSNMFRLVLILGGLAVVLGGPHAVGRFWYHSTYSAMKAEVDVATEGLGKLKPQLTDFVLASRLVAKRVSPSVVSIYRHGSRSSAGQGSGVIVDADGYIVTNYHVVQGAQKLRVRLSDGRDCEATPVGGDAGTDLAVLKIDIPDLIPAQWGDSDALEVGDLVWAIGSPFGLDSTITFGIVSAKGRRSGSGVTQSVYKEYLQTDAAVNPGNSGGPLVDIEGKIIGINTAIVGNSYRGVSLAIPSTMAQHKYQQLVKRGFIEYGFLGIGPHEVPKDLRNRMGLGKDEGVLVGDVTRDGPAKKAGIHSGDVILQWNDHLASDPLWLSTAIAETEIGTIARVVVARPLESEISGTTEQYKRLGLEVTVGRRPSAF